MIIRFGLYLDGQRGWQTTTALGEMVLGPSGLLLLLETHLGLLRKRAGRTERVVQYRHCLKLGDGPARFYHRSFAIDELGVAETLLEWRDVWHLNGWNVCNGAMAASRLPRLRDMAAVEELAAEKVADSVGQRLARIEASLENRSVPIERLKLVDPLDAFPMRWRRVLSYLPLDHLVLPRATGNHFLGRLQDSLQTRQRGDGLPRLQWEDDGSVVVVRAETSMVAGAWVAARLASKQTLLVAQSAGEDLDCMLVSAGHARHGLCDPSDLTPALQVLPLALALLWTPLDFHVLVQFLTHSISPLPSFARRALAEKLVAMPGICGPDWDDVLQRIETFYEEQGPGLALSVRNEIHFWIEQPGYDPQNGADLPAVIAKVNALQWDFQRRLAVEDDSARHAWLAGYEQCRQLAAALASLQAQGESIIRPNQLQKLVAQGCTAKNNNPLHVAEAGAGRAVSQPGAVIEQCEQVIWWQLKSAALPRSSPWSRAERAQLAAYGVNLPDAALQLEYDADTWLRPILAANKRLVLVLPPAGSEIHPVWQHIEAIVDRVPIVELESALSDPGPGMTAIQCVPLPQKRRFWHLPADLAVPAPAKASFSSLEMQLLNPYQWLLKYPARLRPSRALTITGDFLLLGNLAHAVVESYFMEPDALSMKLSSFEHWFEANLDRTVREQGAVLLMSGRRSDLEAFRARLRRAMCLLREQLASASACAVKAEVELAGQFVGGELTGFADLVVEVPTGRLGVIDMKWSGHKKYPAKLANNSHLQLALYAELLRQQRGAWPAVAYFLLDRGRLLCRDTDFFCGAEIVPQRQDGNTAQLWQRFLLTWAWRQAQFGQGLYEVALEGIEETDDSVAPCDGMSIEYLNPAYNDYLALAGWEDQS